MDAEGENKCDGVKKGRLPSDGTSSVVATTEDGCDNDQGKGIPEVPPLPPVMKPHADIGPGLPPVPHVRSAARVITQRGTSPPGVAFASGSPTRSPRAGALRMRLAEGEYFSPPSPRALEPQRVFEPISETESLESVEEDARMDRMDSVPEEVKHVLEPRPATGEAQEDGQQDRTECPPECCGDNNRGCGDTDELEGSSGGMEGILGPSGTNTKYSPLSWGMFFEESKDIVLTKTGDKFHVYTAGKDGPVVFCIHGGGYSGLSWGCSAVRMKEKARVVAMDMRGHGLTETSNDTDLSADTLVSDVIDVIKQMYGETVPPLVLVGHSMGGAIAVRVAARKVLPSLAGLVVVDVVEGTAMASLAYMQAVLASRPRHFLTVERAIEWSVCGGAIRNVNSARVSIPSQLELDANKRWVWKANLAESENHWKGW
ncbi:hypothetical protein CBR_g45928 [Chara braunii]|uniref:protein phosphatase methylesterase-1 n=1 Tax=Chara braunii TaxID=69332 RepID=A0A388LZV0_CHABU|nr:hypothetical protein CBR_g45928 [Chara braunii]|eukprot:GBG87772.1 hypothetical protein CBR_g45928 [Chara braunii]